jgi:two-component system, chemotaxis family, chemotaxis protein CheY
MNKRYCVLVAEDEPSLAKYFQELLIPLGCDVFIEHTGLGAVRRGAELHPDFALLGVVMPELGGAETGIKLREVSPETKIVLISETVSPGVLSDLNAKGHKFETLPAPFTQEELRLVLGI